MSLAFFDISSWPYEDKAIDQAYGEKQHRPASTSSRKTYDIEKFVQLTTSASMASPAPHVAYRLTNAKVKASDVAMEYEPLSEVKPIAGAFKGKGPAKKRRHEEIEEEQGDEDMDDDDMEDLFHQVLP